MCAHAFGKCFFVPFLSAVWQNLGVDFRSYFVIVGKVAAEVSAELGYQFINERK